MSPEELALLTVQFSETFRKETELNQIPKELPFELLNLNQRQKLFVGLAILDYFANFEKNSVKEIIGIEIFDAYLMLLFGIAIASGGKFVKEKDILMVIIEDGALSDEDWFINDDELKELEKIEEKINHLVNNHLLNIFQVIPFLRKFIHQFPLEFLTDFCIGSIDENDLNRMAFLVEYVREIKTLITSKNKEGQ